MALSSLVPHAAYGYGLDREMLAMKLAISPSLTFRLSEWIRYIFARCMLTPFPRCLGRIPGRFLPRYSWMKYKNDEIHGELRPGRSLSPSSFQRDFLQMLLLFGTDFVTIAQTDMDGILAVDTLTTKVTCWYEIYWQIKAVMPLAAFCVPTLGELHDVHTINTTQGGSRL